MRTMQIMIAVLLAGALAVITSPVNVSAQNAHQPVLLAQNTGSLSDGELDRAVAAGFKRISPQELELTAGRGFGTDLNYRQLSSIVGGGFISKLSPAEIRSINARGVSPDPSRVRMMTLNLAQTTIRGVRLVIDKSKFTPRELDQFLEDWQHYLSSM